VSKKPLLPPFIKGSRGDLEVVPGKSPPPPFAKGGKRRRRELLRHPLSLSGVNKRPMVGEDRIYASTGRPALVQNQWTLLAMISPLFPPLIKGGRGGFTGKARHAQRGLLNMH
jgi:hypothetical protein